MKSITPLAFIVDLDCELHSAYLQYSADDDRSEAKNVQFIAEIRAFTTARLHYIADEGINDL
ncbi:hypothetical protein PSCICL_08060 [Pseudomonas cichorii]|nr:hypothetical protein PSCICL_08060 [Pseudomonas cichorii]